MSESQCTMGEVIRESTQVNKTRCPLHLLTTSNSEIMQLPCLECECAWWDSNCNCCAMVGISHGLSGLSREVDNLRYIIGQRR